MREIKFRAWDEKNKIMHNNFQFIRSGTSGNDWIIFISDKFPLTEHKTNPFENPNPYFAQQLKIMQFIGLHDKNGKEIYEGDIVEMRLRENIGTFNVPDDIIANGGYTGREDVYSGEVVYEDKVGYFGINDKGMGVMYFMPGEDTIIEVLGNIYENP